MQDHQVGFLEALAREGNLDAAARACVISPGALRAELSGLERQYGRALLQEKNGETTLTAAGLRLAHWAGKFRPLRQPSADPSQTEPLRRMLAPLLDRRSISPKRLKRPAPSLAEIEAMVAAALAAPDHGGLRPWRLVRFDEDRERLADLFVAEKLRRDPMATETDLDKARAHATSPPALLAFVVSLRHRDTVPLYEQWLAAGAALGNFLNAAHRLGYGAIVLSGDRCHDRLLATGLGLEPHEFLAGFVSLGSIGEPPPRRPLVHPGGMISTWRPVEASAWDSGDARLDASP